ncbi:hypothetical protein E2C01_020917 [Portunus trituberculatus]|uniref:Uncharacterized protein n=1 Tax=Portunus trituberculatus TaxID=210409 RepID=A0A5B7E1V8_PORTR|nr:hypothetical protein [Portunus trituberculatus]
MRRSKYNVWVTLWRSAAVTVRPAMVFRLRTDQTASPCVSEDVRNFDSYYMAILFDGMEVTTTTTTTITTSSTTTITTSTHHHHHYHHNHLHTPPPPPLLLILH